MSLIACRHCLFHHMRQDSGQCPKCGKSYEAPRTASVNATSRRPSLYYASASGIWIGLFFVAVVFVLGKVVVELWQNNLAGAASWLVAFAILFSALVLKLLRRI